MTLKIAGIAQSVEHFTRNEGVVGSSPISSFLFLGVLAQLGARHTGSVEATGSSPVYSI